jgi:hypothetical protein
MEAFTGFDFHYFTQTENPSILYIRVIGGWESPKQHFEQWIPSKENTDLLGLLKDLLDTPTISVARHFVSRATQSEKADEKL